MIIKATLSYILPAIFSYFGYIFLLKQLRKKEIYDKPNQRSSHKSNIPIGGGIILSLTICISTLLLTIYNYLSFNEIKVEYLFLVLLILILATISWIDDLNKLSISIRLLVQCITVAGGLFCLTNEGNLFQGIFPYYIDLIITFIFWVWIINLTNFMDGIDGITSMQGISNGIGVIIILLISVFILKYLQFSQIDFLFYFILFFIGSLTSFIFFNWSPAKLFLGDVGSIPIGFIFGWIFFEISGLGLWQISIIIPLYYLLDSGITLLKRIIKREKVFSAHRTHFYQIAAVKFNSHSYTVITIFTLNIFLIFLSICSILFSNNTIIIICLALFISFLILWYLGHSRK